MLIEIMNVLAHIISAILTALEFLSRYSSLLAIIGIAVAVFTLREMSRQRQESYRPRLFFQNKNFYMQKNANGTPCFLKEEYAEAKEFYGPSFGLILKNIGLGSAHDMTVKWNYDHNRMLSRFRGYAESTGLIRVNKDNHFEYLFKGKEGQGYGFLIRDSEEEKVALSFLSKDETTTIRIPETLHEYLTIVPYLELILHPDQRRIDLKPDEIEIQFQYSDVGGKKHTQTIQMEIEQYSYAKEDNGKNYGFGTLKFTTRSAR